MIGQTPVGDCRWLFDFAACRQNLSQARHVGSPTVVTSLNVV
jgi:hypothetical protein